MRSILLAEDNPFLCKAYVRMLTTEFGTQVDTVTNGADLVEQARATDYGLIVTDNQMPAKDGLEAVAEIRGFNDKVPILLMSSNGSDGLAEKAVRAGASAFLEKTGSRQQFIDACHELYRSE